MIGFIWVLGLTCAMMPLVGINKYVSESYLIVCTFNTWSQDPVDRGYIYVMVFIGWLVPVIVIIFSYLNVSLFL